MFLIFFAFLSTKVCLAVADPVQGLEIRKSWSDFFESASMPLLLVLNICIAVALPLLFMHFPKDILYDLYMRILAFCRDYGKRDEYDLTYDQIVSKLRLNKLSLLEEFYADLSESISPPKLGTLDVKLFRDMMNVDTKKMVLDYFKDQDEDRRQYAKLKRAFRTVDYCLYTTRPSTLWYPMEGEIEAMGPMSERLRGKIILENRKKADKICAHSLFHEDCISAHGAVDRLLISVQRLDDVNDKDHALYIKGCEAIVYRDHVYLVESVIQAISLRGLIRLRKFAESLNKERSDLFTSLHGADHYARTRLVTEPAAMLHSIKRVINYRVNLHPLRVATPPASLLESSNDNQ